ncbi:apoptosis-enhancing nuclease [Pelobates cultripes]|uniref:Exonuclease XPMC2 n=1 Tax=Pelobates cultripes TaxID=61616 RepID=A0AAD1RP85_PELCU|nr:apoptosis-enhancing nuclease [Pelobates cultripes]
MKDFASTSSNLYHGLTESSQHMTVPHVPAPLDHMQIGCVGNRRKSRKHQRFLKRKELLCGLHSMKEKSYKAFTKSNTCSMVSGASQFGFKEKCEKINVEKQSETVGKINTISIKLPEMSGSLSSDLLSSDADSDSGLSMTGSCVSSMPASLTWMKPGRCVALDCEMVGTGPGARTSELARCSVVNYYGDVLYDKYILPELPVTDYRTRWSGITRHHLKHAIPFKTAQKEILNLLKDNRVVGHALHNDFKALKYFPPKDQTRDTSKMRLLNKMAGMPARQNVSLKRLALALLNKHIQGGKKGHSSVEDAEACMELYKIVEDQWEQNLHLYSRPSSPTKPIVLDTNSYMEDQYWPPDLNENYR